METEELTDEIRAGQPGESAKLSDGTVHYQLEETRGRRNCRLDPWHDHTFLRLGLQLRNAGGRRVSCVRAMICTAVAIPTAQKLSTQQTYTFANSLNFLKL